MSEKWVAVSGIVKCGHQVASGKAENSIFPEGTIKMQKPFFQELGLDLANFYEATINVSIEPYIFSMKEPKFTFRQVEWTSLHPPEDFSFSGCKVIFNKIKYNGWIYYPHPETKRVHFQRPETLEIIAPLISELRYGDEIQVLVDVGEVCLQRSPV